MNISTVYIYTYAILFGCRVFLLIHSSLMFFVHGLIGWTMSWFVGLPAKKNVFSNVFPATKCIKHVGTAFSNVFVPPKFKPYPNSIMPGYHPQAAPPPMLECPFLWGIYWTFAKSKGGWVTNRWMLFACKHTLTRWCQINPNHYLNGKYWGDQIFPGNVRVSNQAETVIWYYRNPEFIKEQLYVLNQPNLWCPYEFVSCAYYTLMLSL